MNIQLYDTPRVQEAMGGRELCGLSTVARDDVCILKTAKVLKEHFYFESLLGFFYWAYYMKCLHNVIQGSSM